MDPPNEMRLGEGSNSRERCYPTDFWYPRTVPLKAVYYDYGDVNEVEDGLALDLFWKQLKADILAVEAGKNSYHEPASNLDMVWSQMWWVAREGRLRVNGAHGRIDYGDGESILDRYENSKPSKPEALPVCVVLIREDVYQSMLKLSLDGEFMYDSESKTTKALTLEYLFNRVRDALQPKSKYYSKELARAEMVRNAGLGNINPPFTLGLDFYLDAAAEMVETGKVAADSPEMEMLLQQIAEIAFINLIFSSIRKTWHPGTGCGSQSANYEITAQFHEAMANIGYELFEKDSLEQAEWDEEHVHRPAKKLR